MQRKPHLAALDASSLSRIERGAVRSPFDVFGVQRTERGLLLRVNAPGAWRVEARARQDHSVIAVLDQSQTPGLFAAPFEREEDYLLRIFWPGRVEEREDPYSFGAAIDDDVLDNLSGPGARGAGEAFGAHAAVHEGVPGLRLAAIAPDAWSVSVVGDFNDWDERRHPMRERRPGVWELFVLCAASQGRYAFAVRASEGAPGAIVRDPFCRRLESGVRQMSAQGDLAHVWRDERWLAMRRARRHFPPPVSIYRLEPGAWQGEAGPASGWPKLAERLPPYASALNFTHLQLSCLASCDGGPDWMFAPPPLEGAPEDFAAFVDACHDHGLGVILDWPAPERFLVAAGGEFANLRRNALLDSAMHWLETYHLDGLSLSAHASADAALMESIRAELETSAPGAILIAENEAQAVAGPQNFQWRREMVGNTLTTAPAQAGENALVAITPEATEAWDTHPETNKGSEASAASPTPDPHLAARARAAMALLWMTPGAKLIHMGVELGQRNWADRRIAWELLESEDSLAHLQLVRDLNHALRTEAPVQLITRETLTTTRIEVGADALAFVRAGEAAAPLIIIANLIAHARAIALPAPCPGLWREILNTDSRFYGGSNVGNFGAVAAREQDDPAMPFVLDLLLPPYGALILRHDG